MQGPASMMVQAVCLPSWLKTLVMPIFLPMIPFINVLFAPPGLRDNPFTGSYQRTSIPVFLLTFSLDRAAHADITSELQLFPPVKNVRRDDGSTSSKQTPNGLFICNLNAV